MPLNQAVQTVLAMLRRRRAFILGIFLLTFAPAAALILYAPEKYLADSTVLVRLGREHAMQSYGEGDRPTPINYEQDQIISSAVEIMGSRVLAERAVRDLGYQRIYPKLCDPSLSDQLMQWFGRAKAKRCENPLRDASEQLRRDVNVEAVGRSNVVEAQFEHKDPEVAADVLNKYIEGFQAIYKQLYLDDPVTSLQAEVGRSRQNLALMEKRVVGFESSEFTFEDDGQVERLLLRKAQLQQQLSKLKACCLDTTAAQVAAREVTATDAEIVKISEDRAQLRELLRARQSAELQLTGAINRLRDAENIQDLEKSGVSGVQVISRAEPPAESVRPGTLVRLVLAAAFALIGSIAAALVLELLRRRYSTPEEVEAAFGIPVLANLPFSRDR